MRWISFSLLNIFSSEALNVHPEVRVSAYVTLNYSMRTCWLGLDIPKNNKLLERYILLQAYRKCTAGLLRVSVTAELRTGMPSNNKNV
jgi:hypothetical protein